MRLCHKHNLFLGLFFINKHGLILLDLSVIFYYRMRFFGTDKKVYDDILDLIIELNIKVTAYTGTVKPPVRRSGNRGSGMAGTAHYAA